MLLNLVKDELVGQLFDAGQLFLSCDFEFFSDLFHELLDKRFGEDQLFTRNNMKIIFLLQQMLQILHDMISMHTNLLLKVSRNVRNLFILNDLVKFNLYLLLGKIGWAVLGLDEVADFAHGHELIYQIRHVFFWEFDRHN